MFAKPIPAPLPAAAPARRSGSGGARPPIPRADLFTIRLSSGRRGARAVAMHCVRVDGQIVARYDARHLVAARAHVARLNGEGRA